MFIGNLLDLGCFDKGLPPKKFTFALFWSRKFIYTLKMHLIYFRHGKKLFQVIPIFSRYANVVFGLFQVTASLTLRRFLTNIDIPLS